MTSQPDDILNCCFDEYEFDNLDLELSFYGSSQKANSESDAGSDKHLYRSLNELVTANNINEHTDDIFDSCATPSLATSYLFDEPLFPGWQLDESEIDAILKDPVNEITVTTTDSEAENDNIEIALKAPSESNSNEYEHMTLDEIEKKLIQDWDRITLQAVDDSIQQRTMSVETQPPANLRPRYQSDGLRQIEKARTKPMAIKLPNLQTDSNVLFFLRLTLLTHSKNTSNPMQLHANRLEYHAAGVEELPDGSVCVPLNLDEINEGIKALSRLGIIKTKLDSYKPNLIPYNQSGVNHQSPKNIDLTEEIKITVKQAKVLFSKHNLKASRIRCQLLLKQNDSWHFTNMICETHVIEEKEQTKSSQKRSQDSIDSDDEDSLDERPSPSNKRMKRSN